MFADDVSTPKTMEYVSPDGSVFLPAGAKSFSRVARLNRLALLRQFFATSHVRIANSSAPHPRQATNILIENENTEPEAQRNVVQLQNFQSLL